jgi:hypothetical protein
LQLARYRFPPSSRPHPILPAPQLLYMPVHFATLLQPEQIRQFAPLGFELKRRTAVDWTIVPTTMMNPMMIISCVLLSFISSKMYSIGAQMYFIAVQMNDIEGNSIRGMLIFGIAFTTMVHTAIPRMTTRARRTL